MIYEAIVVLSSYPFESYVPMHYIEKAKELRLFRLLYKQQNPKQFVEIEFCLLYNGRKVFGSTNMICMSSEYTLYISGPTRNFSL
jgi:hypothetical protein